MENKAFKVAGIKNLMTTNYSVPIDLIDLDSEINDSLSMAENRYRIKPKILMLCEKKQKGLFK